jgi:O-antigen ligase
MALAPILGYLFMAICSISFISIASNRFAIGLVLPYEIALIAIIFYSACILSLKKKYITFIPLDWIVLAYVFFALIPVVLSMDNLYIVARDYRHLFLVPLIVYFALPLLFDDVQQLTRAFLFFVVGLIIGSFSLFPEFLQTGNRPKDYNTITCGLLASWSAILAFNEGRKNTFFILKYIMYIIVLLMLMIIALSVSRGVLIGFLFSCSLSLIIFKKKLYQRIFIFSLVSIIILFFISLSVVSESSLKTDDVLSEEYKAKRRTVYRMTTLEFYKDDLKNRVELWKKAYYLGLERPILGRGAFWYRNFEVSTPHNIFISTFLTSGFLGISLFIGLIIASYLNIFSLFGIEQLKNFSKFLFIALTILLIVGATNDFSGGRYLLLFILLSGISTARKILSATYKTVY